MVYTLSSVGYGGSYPTDNVGYIFTMFLMLSGLLSFGFFIAKIQFSLDDVQDYSEYLNEKGAMLESWLAKFERHVDTSKDVTLFPHLKVHYQLLNRHDIKSIFGSTYFG